MARKFTLKQRNSNRKEPKPLILLIAEGRNVTETLYFRQFQVQHAAYNIKIITPGSITDSKGMLEKLEMFWEKNEMDHYLRYEIAYHPEPKLDPSRQPVLHYHKYDRSFTRSSARLLTDKVKKSFSKYFKGVTI